jgi:hypothetical protein
MENVLRHNNQTMISKGGLYAISFAYFISILCLSKTPYCHMNLILYYINHFVQQIRP